MDENAILFKNSYTQSEEILGRFFRHTFFGTNFMLTTDILLIGLFIYCIVSGALENSFNSYMLVPVAFAFYQYFLYKSTFRRAWQSVLRAGGGNPPQYTTSVTEEEVSVDVYGQTMSYPCSRLKRLAVTPKLLLLYIDSKQAIIMPADAFETGSPDEFISWAAEKGIRIQRSKI